MNVVFTDAGYWIALRNTRDVMHGRAAQITHELLREKTGLVITSFVFAEVYAFFSRNRAVREQVIGDIWENPIVQMEHPTHADQEQALKILRTHRDKNFSFVDALSFVVIERRELKRAVSFDGHFRQYGQFEVLGGDLD